MQMVTAVQWIPPLWITIGHPLVVCPGEANKSVQLDPRYVVTYKDEINWNL